STPTILFSSSHGNDVLTSDELRTSTVRAPSVSQYPSLSLASSFTSPTSVPETAIATTDFIPQRITSSDQITQTTETLTLHNATSSSPTEVSDTSPTSSITFTPTRTVTFSQTLAASTVGRKPDRVSNPSTRVTPTATGTRPKLTERTSPESERPLASPSASTSSKLPPTGTQPSTTHVARNETFAGADGAGGVFHENFGLFVFLIVAGAICVALALFGIIGSSYQRRMRTWTPTTANQYAFANMEKRALSSGDQEKGGIESPLSDIDILRDEKTIDGISLSQASTVECSPPKISQTPVVYDNVNPLKQEPEDDDLYVVDATVTSAENPGNGNGDTYFPRGSDVTDGLVPVDELDNLAPRALFPWIEHAADTQL
ncbi:hypothetical protein MAR_012286, partial [Mya arenaria]